MSDFHDVIAAFADGEPVDPAELVGALADAEGREHLVDVLVLRGLVGGSPGARPVLAAGSLTARRGSHGRRWAAIAALVVAGVGFGFLAGQRLSLSSRPDAATGVQNTQSKTVPVVAPSPTRVIRLQNGVDWNERTGGN